jgi:hypothetical protein
MPLEDRVHALRLRLFRRAHELGNLSDACREAGVSRSAYSQLRERFRRCGADGRHPKHRKSRPGRPPELEAVVERRILAEALAQPTPLRGRFARSLRVPLRQAQGRSCP